MFCPSCGTKNNYYHRYCFHCGTKLINDEDTEPQAKAPVQDSTEQVNGTDYIATSQESDDNTAPINHIDFEDETSNDNTLQNNTTILQDVKPDKVSSQDDLADNADKDDISDYFSNLFTDDDYNTITEIPLRRYNKDTNSDKLQRFIKISIFAILAVLVGLLFFIGYDHFIKNDKPTEPVIKRIDLNYDIEQVSIDDKPAHKIKVSSTNGDQVELLGKKVALVNGQAEFTFYDTDFSIDDFEQVDNNLIVSLDLLAKADGYPNRIEEIEFAIPLSYAPLTFISPSDKVAEIDGENYQVALNVLPGSDVYINDNNYSHLVDESGQLSILLEIPNEPKTSFQIKVSYPDYEDNVQEILFTRKQMDFPLSINQKIPVVVDENSEWVEISGNTHPKASLTTSLELRDDPVIDPETGDFQLSVKIKNNGFTPLTITSSLEGKEDSVLKLVIERKISESTYTTSAWATDYDELVEYPDLHNGFIFTFEGTIERIDSTGSKTTLLVNLASEGQPEQYIDVDYWGSLSLNIGQKVRVFGNKWGCNDNIPYIIAKYVQ